ncbi:MAG TPA: hypothetical protein VKS79_18835 [Gemmataceae bacterium]|nr:hypothetical protein [Gemmataceae bacterium]
MERSSSSLNVRRIGKSIGIAVALACLATGCETTSQWFSAIGGSPKPSGPPQHMEAIWTKGVQWVPDPTKSGQPGPVLACRLYFFTGDDVKFTSTVDGTLTVDLYDDSNRTAGDASKPMEKWIFKADALKNMLQKDAWLGQGYTIGLPWPTYRPDIKEVHLNMTFEPSGGGQPITTMSGIMTLGSPVGAGIQQASYTKR